MPDVRFRRRKAEFKQAMTFYENLGRFGQAPAFILENGETLTYENIEASADDFGAHLKRGALTMILADNCAPSLIGYLGCLRSKCPVMLLARTIDDRLVASLIGLYRPNYIWLPEERAHVLSRCEKRYATGGYELLLNSDEAVSMHVELALLMSTSGSTGSPKFVRQSYGNIASNAASIVQSLDIRGEDRAITVLPMHYVYGLSVINSHLSMGAAVILTDASLMEKRFWNLMKSQRATSLSGVPYTFEVLKRLKWTRMDLPSLRMLTQAGGKLSAALVQEFASQCLAKGILFYVMYGAAEATARMAYLLPHLALTKPASIGMAIPGGEFWLEDDSGSVVTDPEVAGELVYKGSNVALGYAQCAEDLVLGDERGGILMTGDLAKRDNEGAYFIVGRKSRFVKIYGNRVNLEDVEALLHEANIECACAGIDDLLTIYVTDRAQVHLAVSFAQQVTGLPRKGFRAEHINRIPRNEAGKILYANLEGLSWTS